MRKSTKKSAKAPKYGKSTQKHTPGEGVEILLCVLT